MSEHHILSELEARILQYGDLRAEVERPEIARHLKVPLHKVHHAFERLFDRGILYGRLAYLDCETVSATPYSVLVGLLPFHPITQDKLRRFLNRSPEVCWVSQVLAGSQISCQLFAKSPASLRTFFEKMQSSSGTRIAEKEFALRTTFWAFEKRYLTDRSCRWRRAAVLVWDLGRNEGDSAIHISSSSRGGIDELDSKLLSVITRPHTEPLAAIARSLGVPAQTLHRRAVRLRERGVIKAYGYAVKLSAIGVRRYRILITTAGFDSVMSGKLAVLARDNPHVVNFGICLGNWDFEFAVECRYEGVVAAFLNQLGEVLGPVLRTVRVLPVVGFMKVSSGEG